MIDFTRPRCPRRWCLLAGTALWTIALLAIPHALHLSEERPAMVAFLPPHPIDGHEPWPGDGAVRGLMANVGSGSATDVVGTIDSVLPSLNGHLEGSVMLSAVTKALAGIE